MQLKMNLIFFPSDFATNQYGNIITNGLMNYGIKLITYETAFKSFKTFLNVDLVHLNWFETLGSKSTVNFKRFLGRGAKLLAFKLFGKKIIWTMHNKMPHDQKDLWLKKLFMQLIIKSSDLIIVHSKSSIGILISEFACKAEKIKYIPHPDYIGVYPAVPNQIADTKLPEKKVLKLLFLGAVKPYKNIELLIDVIKPFTNTEVQLTIAGKASGQYKNSIIDYVGSSSNINLILEFIPDEKLTSIISDSDLLILPYDVKSSLNSGTVILAFSNRKTVICPAIGTISDLPDSEMVLSYSYQSQIEHFQELNKVVAKAIKMKKENPRIWEDFGTIVFNDVSSRNNKDKIIDEFIATYKSIIK